MFRKSRKRIVASIMMILAIVFVSSLSVIFISSYIEMSRQNQRMLKEHANMYDFSSQKRPYLKEENRMSDNRFEPKFADTPEFKLSTFYSVAISYEGEVLEIRNNSPTVHTNEDLSTLAKSIIEGNKTKGRKNNLLYYKVDKNGYNLVTFMDNTVVNKNALTLFRYTLIFGSVSMVLFFFLSVYLAKRIVRPLEESYQKQKQFISDAGHELKTPVSVVNANAELLSREIGDNQWLSNIQYENERMGILVGQLLELARVETVVPQMQTVELSHLVDGEILPFESVAFEEGVGLNCYIEKNIEVIGNASQLKQLVAILLDNAIRHCTKPGDVSIRLRKEHGYASFIVSNNGEPIPKEQYEKIFERFYRMDTARNDEGNHYGLGLAIAKSIVDAHRGTIKVQCSRDVVEFIAQIPVNRNN